jgi:hypothetical protein
MRARSFSLALVVVAAQLVACRSATEAVIAPDAAPTTSASSASASSEPPAAPPPYNLAADLAARAAAARVLFPASQYPALVTHVEADVFLLVSPQGPAMLAAGATQLRRGLAFYYDGHSGPTDPSPPFAKHADRALTVILFASRQPFIDFARTQYQTDAGNMLGFFRRTPREIVISGHDGLGTLLHEIVHSFPETRDLPLWMDEGLGSLFEQPLFDADGTMHGASNARNLLLRDALRRGSKGEPPPGISRLFGMTAHQFKGGSPRAADGGTDEAAKGAAEAMSYATARAFCQWLDAKPRQKLWQFVHAWRDERERAGKEAGDAASARDVDGRAAFAAVMAGPPEAFDEEWRAWVMGKER